MASKTACPQKIDCHTHIYNQALRNRYFSVTDGYAIVMQFIDRLRSPEDVCEETVKADDRLFLCAGVDIALPLAPQFAWIEENLTALRIVGIKIYLTYQKGRASDSALFPIYEFAARHRLAVIFHTGIGAAELPSDNDQSGSDAEYVAVAAEKYPDCHFILAHMNDPRFHECLRVVTTHQNVFTDFCGIYEEGTVADVDTEARRLKEAIDAFPDAGSRILFGTDFCPPLHMPQITEYEETVRLIFPPEQWENIFFNNCLDAFPRLREYLKDKTTPRK